MPETPISAPQDSEDLTQSIGQELFRRIRDASGRASRSGNWEDAFLQRLMGDPQVRTQLLRFVDVYPALKSARAYAGHARHMDFARMRRLRQGPVITILYPPILAVLIPLLLALVPALILSLALPWWAAAIIGMLVSALLSGRILAKLVVPWLLRFMTYHGALAAQGPGAALDARIDAFAQRLEARGLVLPVLPVDVRRRGDVLLLIDTLIAQAESGLAENAA